MTTVILDLGTVASIDLNGSPDASRGREELAAGTTRCSIARDIGQVRDMLRMEGDEMEIRPTIDAAIDAANERSASASAEPSADVEPSAP